MPRETDDALDPTVLETAAEWMMRLGERDASEADRAACMAWQRAHPDHALAWSRVERLRGLFASVPASVAHPVLDRPARAGRRAALRGLGACLALAPAGWAAWRYLDARRWDATWRTSTAQRRHVVLDDGTQARLDSRSTLHALYDEEQRLLRLDEGQVVIDTAPDHRQPPRPFLVETEHGRMQALGTRFNVRVDADRTCLSVLEGAVLTRPSHAPGDGVRVEAGQAVSFDRVRCDIPAHTDERTVSWTLGMLAADAMPLRQVLEALSRYRHGVVRCDPTVAGIRVSGAFPLDDTDKSLAMLAATYPVTIDHRLGGWWVVVTSRDPR